jgi:hypothetical protein
MIEPTEEQVREWVRESNHNRPMFYQVACMAAAWGYNQHKWEMTEQQPNE